MDLVNKHHTTKTLTAQNLSPKNDLEANNSALKASSADSQAWECPGLINEDTSTSPTTSFDSWAPFTPPQVFRGQEDSTFPEQCSANLSFSNFDHAETLKIEDGHDHTATSSFALSDLNTVDASENASDGSLSFYRWSGDPYTSQSVTMTQHGAVVTPSTYLPFDFRQSGYSPDENAFPVFRSSLVSTQLAGVDHYGADKKPNLGHDDHIVPGLLSNTVLDNYHTARSISNTPALEDYQWATDTAQMTHRPQTLSSQNDSSTPYSSLHHVQLTAPLTEAARSDKDDYLLQCRNKGLSYKEIKRRGGFKEAESTLRGRIRILSKPKHKRVRKPQWHHSDVILLRQAIEENAAASSAAPSNIARSGRRSLVMSRPPWKKVSETMQKNGASYPFAPATCAKKWEQVQYLFQRTH
ncbi:hypothetical protein MBLNU459_g4615t1, partial [Dothideomycetes sp. NU459]